jgi:hypothetical protein
MIIIEGPDGAGKTTLAQELSSRYGFRIGGTRGPNDNVRGRVYSALGAAVAGAGPIRIYDRLFYSELVYGPILRGRCLFSPIEQNHIHHVLEVLRCPIIFCLPDLDVILKNLEQKEHLEGVRENIAAIHASYQDLFLKTPSAARLLYAYTRNGIKDWTVIDHYVERRRERTWD